MPDSITITREWIALLESLPTVQSRWNVLRAVSRFAFDGVKPDDLDAIEKVVFMSMKNAIQERARKRRYIAKKRHEPSTVPSTVDASRIEGKPSTVDVYSRRYPSDELPLNIEEDQGIFKQDNTIDSSKVLKKEKEIKSSTNSIMREKDKSSPEKRKIFVPPTLEEVREYCQFRRNAVNPEQFMARYESNGWMVGRNKMKDWKAAVRYWEQKMYEDRKTLSQKRDYSGI